MAKKDQTLDFQTPNVRRYLDPKNLPKRPKTSEAIWKTRETSPEKSTLDPKVFLSYLQILENISRKMVEQMNVRSHPHTPSKDTKRTLHQQVSVSDFLSLWGVQRGSLRFLPSSLWAKSLKKSIAKLVGG